jgi:drug/metabolite transporter (DMT)-like permease
MGLCTLGLAYACWDYGARRGDVRVMGAGAYLTPLLSTLILVQLGDIMVGNDAWLGCLLIIFGAVLGGGREIFVRRQS